MCLNSGTLHLCNNCPRAVCHQCPPLTPDVDVSKLDFLCLACYEVIFNRGHLPYYVSVIVLFSLLSHFPLIVGILCLPDIRSWWKSFPPAAFSPETWNGQSHESTRGISNVLSIPSQHR